MRSARGGLADLFETRLLGLGQVFRHRQELADRRRRALVAVDVVADHVVGVDAGEPAGDAGADVAALGSVAIVAETPHQLGEGVGGPPHLPARLADRHREAEAGQRRTTWKASAGSPPGHEDR